MTLPGPVSLKCCAPLTKPHCREKDVRVDFPGFEIPEAWVVGYALEERERYRALPLIGVPPV